MVLTEAQTDSGFTDNAPASDADTSAFDSPDSPSTSTPKLNIELSNLPRPIPLIGPLLGYSDTVLASSLQQALHAASTILKRPLTQSEADALSTYQAQSHQYSSYGATGGVGFGIYTAYQGRKTFRFPFKTPGEGFNPESLAFLRGQTARFGWHSLRGVPYVVFGWMLGTAVSRVLVTSVVYQSMQRDERVQEFNKALTGMVRERAGGVNRGQAPLPAGQGQAQAQEAGQYEDRGQLGTRDRGMGMGHGSGNREAIMEQIRERKRELAKQEQQQDRASGAMAAGDDDMSPSGGTGLFDSDAGTDTGLMSDEQMRQRDVRQRVRGSTSEENTFQMNKVASQPDRQEDAAAGSRGSQSSSGGSAWDRLRQGAKGGQPPQPGGRAAQRESQQGSTVGDSFSFSAADENRQLAKAEAQREFDARIERERQGQDFDESKRWR